GPEPTPQPPVPVPPGPEPTPQPPVPVPPGPEPEPNPPDDRLRGKEPVSTPSYKPPVIPPVSHEPIDKKENLASPHERLLKPFVKFLQIVKEKVINPTQPLVKEKVINPTQPQMRLITYMHPKPSDDYDNFEKDPKEARRIGERGEKIVIEVEERQGRRAINANLTNPNNKGYDIESTFGDKTIYIEVKSTKDSWGSRGVPITYEQYEFALEKREAWWLYVVEHVDRKGEDGGPIIHRIPNPFIKESPHRITEFRFDGGWREFAITLGNELPGSED
ncbi:MAG: DUF3883 domain-containing protein, partial [Candidatus Contendobacter sp.]|nr:DUF3883 domain-containing protein [Candidatus Contendobacter sp.]